MSSDSNDPKALEVMRRRYLTGEQYHWLKEELYHRKVHQYKKALEILIKEQKVA